MSDPQPAEDYEYDDFVQCWQCGGDGQIAMCEEEFACIDPEGGCEFCMRRCDICEGKGGWPLDPETDDQ